MLKPIGQHITVYDTCNIDWVSITFSEHFSESIALEKGDENVRIHIEKNHLIHENVFMLA